MVWVMTSAKPDTVFMITRLGPWLGKDRGNEWEFVDLKPFSPITHTRDFKVDPHNPNVFYVGVGASVFGEDGAVMRSKDLGRVWERVDKGVKPNSTVRSVSLSIQTAVGHLLLYPLWPGLWHPRRRRYLANASLAGVGDRAKSGGGQLKAD